MKAYNFTDSDLDALSLTGIVSGVAFSVGSGLLALCLEVKKDILMIESPTKGSLALDFSTNWFGFPLAIAILVVGVIALWRRGSIIRRVKNESQQLSS